VKIVDYEKKFNAELNTWQDKENTVGLNGLNRFVVPEGALLGEYLAFITSELNDTKVSVVLEGDVIIGFVGYSSPNEDCIHIEIMGVNPECTGKGYAKQILQEFKTKLSLETGAKYFTLAVKRENNPGIKAFSKIGKRVEKHDSEQYIGFEI
jgi:RimJ/RimL family protein N-acetyltransferase